MPSTLCAFCKRLAHMTVTWGEIFDGPANIEVRIAATCDHCGNLSTARGETNFVPTHRPTSEPSYVKAAVVDESVLEWWPKVGDAPMIEDVPAHIARAAREAYSSQSVGNYQAAILMARTVVEATAKAKGITSGTLAAKINAMRDAQHIRPAIAEQAHEVRFMGNDMAHGDIEDAPDPLDSEEILALMAEVLSEVFQGPARLERIRARRTGATS